MYTRWVSGINLRVKCFYAILMLVSEIRLACASADTNLMKGPVGSVSELLKKSHMYQFLNELSNDSKTEFLDRLKYDVLSETYPSIQNLNEYLQPFEKCLVYMTNHRSIEIHPATVHIILAEMETQLWQSKATYGSNFKETIE